MIVVGQGYVAGIDDMTCASQHGPRSAHRRVMFIIQCKRYRARVTSGHVQQFNGTARPHHGADVAIMIGLAGFTEPAAAFARQHHITVLGRAEIKKWAHGTHLYQAVNILT